MHILVVNDDGPISTSSPYIYPFVSALQQAGHRTSVVLPDKPRSWIGKAHMVGSTLECSYYTPAPGADQWTLVNGTPASCTQLGLHHLLTDLPPVDLVVSGPNFGRNATTIYNLSSGTVGGALEAALCRKKAIAISFASKEQQSSEIIAAAARISVQLIEKLWRKWGPGVELYNINVPMTANVGACKVLYTQALPSSWISGSLYQETNSNGLINGLSKGHINGGSNGALTHKTFKWAPQLSDISRCVEESPPGTDAWAVSNGSI
ncbi:hypothetical protein MMC07_001207, partial [Pseudocyphellaria aurata]|nr:hypothetical protein [Pseudocyphellaria aurata]